MKLGEKMSYLMGLLDGMEIDTTTKEGKALVQMAEVMQEVVEYVDDLQSQIDELTELCDNLDYDLGEIEEDFYDFDECDCGCEDEDDLNFEVTCPDCGITLVLDDDMIDKGSVDCPNCGTNLEFDFDEIDESDDFDFGDTLDDLSE